MREIIKRKEPTSLTTYRASISKEDLKTLEKFDTSPSAVKDDLRNKLLEEQGYICCYCMDRVEFHHSKIEHFKPRSLFRGEQLDYSNLFVACLGGEGRSKAKQHCDTQKGKNELKNIDLLSNIGKELEYKKDGFIFSKDVEISRELDEVLNLNYEVLKINREDALNQFTCELKKNGWTVPNLKSMLEKYKHKNAKGKYRPFCEMIVYFLNKKLKQKGIII